MSDLLSNLGQSMSGAFGKFDKPIQEILEKAAVEVNHTITEMNQMKQILSKDTSEEILNIKDWLEKNPNLYEINSEGKIQISPQIYLMGDKDKLWDILDTAKKHEAYFDISGIVSELKDRQAKINKLRPDYAIELGKTESRIANDPLPGSLQYNAYSESGRNYFDAERKTLQNQQENLSNLDKELSLIEGFLKK